MDNACETPLVDLLRALPKDARMVYAHTPTSHSLIPVGVHSHRAADLIATLEAERDALRAEVAKLRAAQANMIDATGAVETGVFWYSGRYVVEIPKSMALSRVLIVPVKQ